MVAQKASGGHGPRYFVPDGLGGFRPADLLAWAAWYERTARDEPPAGDFRTGGRVVAWESSGAVTVSTVFLGADHSHGHGPPVLFETMIFGGPHDEYQRRYSTLAEAEAGHAEAVALAKGGPS